MSSQSESLQRTAQRRDVVLAEIAKAERLARRDPGSAMLIAVTKTHGADEIEELILSGQRDFGESRVQEALAKWPSLRAPYPDIRLHLIGQLQSNKAVEAVTLFNTIHSLDRRSLLDALVAAAVKTGRTPAVYVQVNIGGEGQKGGVAIDDLSALIDAVRASPLMLQGLMAIPPRQVEPGPYFALLAKLAQRHDVTGLSMGMSGDYSTAVMLGATAVRVGSALFED